MANFRYFTGARRTGPADLAARVLGYPYALYVTNWTLLGIYAMFVIVPADTQTPYSFLAASIMPGHPHFPFGYAVEPDDLA